MIIIENLDEINDEVLASVLKCLERIIDIVKDTPNIFLSLLPILKRKNILITKNILGLIITFLTKNDQSLIISRREWLRLIYEIIDNLDKSKIIRKRATLILGMIGRLIGPQWVLNILLETIRSNEDGLIRNISSMGVAIIGLSCGPFNIIPGLMCDYSIPNIRVKIGILKSIKYLFYGSGTSAYKYIHKEYIYTLLPLLEDSMTEKDYQIRSLGIECVRHIIFSMLPYNIDFKLVSHLFNFVFLSILDERVEEEVNGVFEVCVYVLGVNILYKYIVQGLYHPAKRIRRRYYKIYDIISRLGYNQLIMCYDSLLLEEGIVIH